MSYVNCARFPKEQNLVAVQCQGQIFYESCKEICQNQELLVWYGDCYEKFLDIPVSLQVTEQGKQAPRSSEGECNTFAFPRGVFSSGRTWLFSELEQPFSSLSLTCGAHPPTEANVGEIKLRASLTRGTLPSWKKVPLSFQSC